MRLLDALIARAARRRHAAFRSPPTSRSPPSTSAIRPPTSSRPRRARRFNIRFNDIWTPETLRRRAAARGSATAPGMPRYDADLRAVQRAWPSSPSPAPFTDSSSRPCEPDTGRRPVLSTTGGTSDARFIKDYCPVVEFGLVGADDARGRRARRDRRPRAADGHLCARHRGLFQAGVRTGGGTRRRHRCLKRRDRNPSSALLRRAPSPTGRRARVPSLSSAPAARHRPSAAATDLSAPARRCCPRIAEEAEEVRCRRQHEPRLARLAGSPRRPASSGRRRRSRGPCRRLRRRSCCAPHRPRRASGRPGAARRP